MKEGRLRPDRKGPLTSQALLGVEGYQAVLQEMVSSQPKAAALNAKELVDARFVKELEDGGFVASLHKK
jgi:hypothetical protein